MGTLLTPLTHIRRSMPKSLPPEREDCVDSSYTHRRLSFTLQTRAQLTATADASSVTGLPWLCPCRERKSPCHVDNQAGFWETSGLLFYDADIGNYCTQHAVPLMPSLPVNSDGRIL